MPADPRPEKLLFALAAATGVSKACATHGDDATVAVLEAWYDLSAASAALAGGSLIKMMGDGVLLTFPVGRAKDAIDALRGLKETGSALWARFDARCRVQIKVGAGTLVAGMFGPNGAERPDVYGRALNELFKLPFNDFEITAEAKALL